MENTKIAVLIDAENISYKNTRQIIDTMSTKGDVIIKEIIADWTRISKGRISPVGADKALYYREKQIEGWRKEASIHSMTAVQQFSYVSGKNTSDIALTISAMKILFEKPFVDVFCIVSNDSDFTRLAQELREHNKEVVGMGERQKAIPEFVNAFSEFIYLGEAIDEGKEKEEESKPEAPAEEPATIEKKDNKKKDKNQNKVAEATKKPEKQNKKDKGKTKKSKSECVLPKPQLEALKVVVEDILSEHDGIAFYSLIAIRMKQQFPDFVPANYDCKSTSALMEKILPFMPEYVLHKQPMPNNPNGSIMMLKHK